ncbi:MAG: hypothetical protein QOD06_714 [Candidatus Binatota bacterium]|nr:hypothetical protein [Candidatus Binatota bacterium]
METETPERELSQQQSPHIGGLIIVWRILLYLVILPTALVFAVKWFFGT